MRFVFSPRPRPPWSSQGAPCSAKDRRSALMSNAYRMSVDSVMNSNLVPADSPATPQRSPRSRWRAAWPTWAILIGVLLLGGYFRSLSLFAWDEPSFRLHPDERFL